ncbi:MAG: hypothetical protein JWM08_86 [Candidatus Angelobacter sp.]|jgi:hypothetical protein|nr:hypothetical protein [Candidatus Angelobacter sp.]
MLTDNKMLEIRSRFPTFQRNIYLNSCSQGENGSSGPGTREGWRR